MYELSEADHATLTTFFMKAKEHGSAYPGMSFEDGIEAVLDVIDGNQTAEEAIT